MAWYRIAENVLDAIANAINAKTGGTSPMTPVEMVSEIQSIQTGGNTLESDFVVIRKETVVAGENSVANTAEHYAYLSSLKSISGTLLAVSMHPKASYQYNEIGCGLSAFNTAGPAYRYRDGWASASYNVASYDAILVSGSIYDLYTVELINPATA